MAPHLCQFFSYDLCLPSPEPLNISSRMLQETLITSVSLSWNLHHVSASQCLSLLLNASLDLNYAIPIWKPLVDPVYILFNTIYRLLLRMGLVLHKALLTV